MAGTALESKKLCDKNDSLLNTNNKNFSVSVTQDDDENQISSGEESSECEEESCGDHAHAKPASAIANISRNEKKARKLFSKLDLVHVPDIKRVTICRSKNVVFVISNADVYKNPNTNSYVVFGEAKVEDMGMAAQAQAARRFQEQQEAMLKDAPSEISTSSSTISEEDESLPIDESGLEAKYIEMVMSHCNVSRRRAVTALRENEGDIVNATMALSE